MKETTVTVRPLTAHEWLNRLSSVWPEYAAKAYDGLPSDALHPKAALRWLSERFEAFDSSLGDEPGELDPEYVCTTRTLLGSLKKFRDYTADDEELTAAAMRRYRENNSDARLGEIPRRFEAGMRRFLRTVLDGYDRASTPHFGPGAVEERMSLLRRWDCIAHCAWYDFASPDDIGSWQDGPARSSCRLCAVPKDWNKRRLITVEPFELSYLQHMTRGKLWKALRGCSVAGLRRLAQPAWRDPQAAHRAFAQRGSVDGTLATLDLRDASDLVSLNQVLRVFPGHVAMDLVRSRSDTFFESTDGCRTDPATINMYGGMGNGTTFTVETLMFHAACHAIADYHRLGFRDSFISCYGDDLVLSTRLAELIMENDIFSEFGWRVNPTKSYWRPGCRFRESCGGQYYNGHDVTLLRYQGAYGGLSGLVAYRELIHRCASNVQWMPLVAHPWPECSNALPNSDEWFAPGGLFTSVPWWPNTYTPSMRVNRATQEKELLCNQLRIERAYSSNTGLGLVYGALSGQLARLTGCRRVRGRKRSYIAVPVPDRISVTQGWSPCVRLGGRLPTDVTVPGLRDKTLWSDYDIVLGMLKRQGYMD